MSSTNDNDEKFFKELFMLIILFSCFIAAWIWDGKREFINLWESISHEQPIEHETGRSPVNYL